MTNDEIDAMLRAAGGRPVAAPSVGAGGHEEHTITFSPGLLRRYLTVREEALWSHIESSGALAAAPHDDAVLRRTIRRIGLLDRYRRL